MGPDYFIPKPFDPRALWWVAPAVAQAAMDSGVARIKFDPGEYRERLMLKGSNAAYSIMRTIGRGASPGSVGREGAATPRIRSGAPRGGRRAASRSGSRFRTRRTRACYAPCSR